MQAIDDPARDRVSASPTTPWARRSTACGCWARAHTRWPGRSMTRLAACSGRRSTRTTIGPLASFDRAAIEAAVNAVATASDREGAVRARCRGTAALRAADGQERTLDRWRKPLRRDRQPRRIAALRSVRHRRVDRHRRHDATRPGRSEQDVIDQLDRARLQRHCTSHAGLHPALALRLRRAEPAALHDRCARRRRRERLRRLGRPHGNGAIRRAADAWRNSPKARSTRRSTATTPAIGCSTLRTMRPGQLRFTVQVMEPNVGSAGQAPDQRAALRRARASSSRAAPTPRRWAISAPTTRRRSPRPSSPTR